MVLEVLQPETVGEYGPGESTRIISNFPSVKQIISVEHSLTYYRRLHSTFPRNVCLMYRPNLVDYVDAIPRGTYDLIFVDGRERVKCLKKWRNNAKVVILHDANREKYQEGIKRYKYIKWDKPNATMILTNHEDIRDKLSRQKV